MINLQDYIADSNLFRSFPIDDVLFVEYRCLINDTRSEIWTHDNYFAYVLGGEKRWTTPAVDIKVGPGEALFVRKGASSVYQYFEQPFVVLFVFIPDEFVRKVMQRHPDVINSSSTRAGTADPLIRLDMNSILESFFHSLLSHFSENAIQSTALLKLKMEELVLSILTQKGNVELRRHFTRIAWATGVDIEEMMNANFLRPLSLSDFARLCGRSLSSFRRDFQNTFHTTPGKWLIEKRLDQAKLLLETTQKNVNEIVDVSGFKNRPHFTKAFKHRFGVSPRVFRNDVVRAH